MTNIFAILFFLLAEFSLKAKLISEYSTIETNHKVACPRCRSQETVKNGSIHNGKPKNKCKNCGYHFVINPTNKTVSDKRKQLIGKLLLERLSLRGITRVTGVSWLVD